MSLFTKVEDHVNRSFGRISAALSGKADGKQLADLAENVQQQARTNRAVAEDQARSIEEELRQLKTELTDTGLAVRSLLQHEQDACRRLDELESSRSDADQQHARRLDRLESTRGGLAQVARRVEQLERTIAAWHDVMRRVEAQHVPDSDRDEFYAELEDHFRGTEEDIRGRQEQYLQFVNAAGAGTTEAPLLDLGCGRGEWLNLLRDHGMKARGVDLNEVFLRRCRQKHLEVDQADALQYLHSTTPGSLGAITGFHIIEHMPADKQLRLIELAFRALRPGGLLILETPNPEHLSVAALRFHYDPTHVRPVPSVLMEFMAKHVGFRDVRIELSSPSGDGEAAQGWSCFQDYALIAVRPADK
jgi:O-antigen chain-terminating methyltransferase